MYDDILIRSKNILVAHCFFRGLGRGIDVLQEVLVAKALNGVGKENTRQNVDGVMASGQKEGNHNHAHREQKQLAVGPGPHQQIVQEGHAGMARRIYPQLNFGKTIKGPVGPVKAHGIAKGGEHNKETANQLKYAGKQQKVGNTAVVAFLKNKNHQNKKGDQRKNVVDVVDVPQGNVVEHQVGQHRE